MKTFALLVLLAGTSFGFPNASDIRGVSDNVIDVHNAKELQTFVSSIDTNITDASKHGRYAVDVHYTGIKYDVVYGIVTKLRDRGYTVNIDRVSHMIVIEWKA